MIEWRRSNLDRRCGGCGRMVLRGAPLLVFTIEHVQKVRGECCEGPAPEELPPLPEPARIDPTPLVHIPTGPAVLPLDFRQRQAGEDDD